jgi:hypothetical protein
MSPYASDLRASCIQRTPAAVFKRSRSSSSDVKLQALCIPVGVWEDHLLPLLMSKDTALLGRVCKALTEMAREHTSNLGTVKLRKLQSALTTFPRARKVVIEDCSDEWGDEGRRELLDWLGEEDRGRYLKEFRVEDAHSPAREWVHAAVLSNALSSLKGIDAGLVFEDQREAFMEGLLGGVQELRVDIETNRRLWCVDVESQLEALMLVGKLPALSTLEVRVIGEDDEPVKWPNFTPPSLKALTVDVTRVLDSLATESLLPALPDVLEASGARLDRLEIGIPVNFTDIGDGPPGPGPALLPPNAQGLPPEGGRLLRR